MTSLIYFSDQKMEYQSGMIRLYGSFSVLPIQPVTGIGGPRRQQQREPPVDRYRTIAVGRIIGLGEGVD